MHSGKSRTEAQDQLKVSKRLGQIQLARLSENICQTILSFAVNAEFKYLLQGTQTDYKNELLFTEFGINYASLPVMFRKVRGLKCN